MAISRFLVLVAALCSCPLFSLPGRASCQEKVFSVGEGVISMIAISPKGDMVAIDAFAFMAGESLIVLFDMKSGKEYAVYRMGRFLGVQALAFSQDGKCLMSVSGKSLDGELVAVVKFWDIAAGREVKTYFREGQLLTMTNRWIVTRAWPGCDIVRIFDLESGESAEPVLRLTLKKDFSAKVEKAVLSPDGKYLATAERGGRVRVWKLPSGEEVFSANHTADPNRILFLENNSTLAVTAIGTYLYDLNAKKLVYYNNRFYAMAFSKDGKLMATRGEVLEKPTLKRLPDAVHVMATEKKTVVASFAVDKKWQVRQVQFSPDNRLLIAAGDGGIVRIWDVSKIRP